MVLGATPVSNVRIAYVGGGQEEWARREPAENRTNYPEPSTFGTLPASAFFIRHVKNLEMSDIKLSYAKEDVRPPLVIENVQGADLSNIKAEHRSDVPVLILRDVENLRAHRVQDVKDVVQGRVDEVKL